MAPPRHDAGARPEAKGETTLELPAAGLAAVGRAIVATFGFVWRWGRRRRARKDVIEELLGQSRARSIDRWVAAGLTRDEAVQFADDPALAALATRVEIPEDGRLVILTGDAGAGKSLIAEQLLRSAIDRARARKRPLPAFVPAKDATALGDVVRSKTSELGDSRRRGVFVVVDGAEQAGVLRLGEVVSEARVLAETKQQNRVVVTARNLPFIGALDEVVPVPPLSEDESCALISRVAGKPVTKGMLYSWPTQVRQAVRLPLFAIFLGVFMRDPDSSGPTRATLLSHIASRAVAQSADPNLLDRLRTFATLWLDAGGAVSIDAISDSATAAALAHSGLVTEETGALDFPLPVIGQWFGAQALRSDDALRARVLHASIDERERWRDSLAMAVGGGGPPADEILDHLAAHDPGLAADVVTESVARWPTEEDPPLPSTDQVAVDIRHAMTAWAEGLGPVASLVAPVDANRTLLPLAVASGEHDLSVAWLIEPAASDVVPMTTDVYTTTETWDGFEWSVTGSQPGWAFAWTLNQLQKRFQRVLEQRALIVDSEPFQRELTWSLATSITGSSHLFPIRVDVLAERLSRLAQFGPLSVVEDAALERLRREIDSASQSGLKFLNPPWGVPDVPPSSSIAWVWDWYTPEQLLAIANAVYGAALEIYEAIADTWLPSLRDRLSTALTLPAVLTGELDVSPQSRARGAVTLRWHLEPKPTDESTSVDIRLATEPDNMLAYDSLRALVQRARSMRPHAAERIGVVSHHQVLDVFNRAPATDVAYRMLWDDLKRISWTSGMFR